MSSVYYTSLSGMMAASYGLQNTSNNIANMQSPGFKRSDVFYSSLNNGGQGSLGSGVTVGGHSTNFAAGTYLETNNPADLAIVGNGFFIVKLKNGELLYTRDGEFGFNPEGLLIDKHSGGLVQGYDKKGALTSISQTSSTINPGKATHYVDIKGEWSVVELEKDPNLPDDPDPFKSKFEPIRFQVGRIFDADGKEHTIHLEFEAPSSPGSGTNPLDNLSWHLEKATCDDANITFDPQFIEFESLTDGAPTKANHLIALTLNGHQKVQINFGDYGKDKDSSIRLNQKTASSPSSTSVQVIQSDGYGEGKPIGFSFDDNGQITYHYDNGQSDEGVFVALAMFDDLEHTLVQAHDNLFRANSTKGLKIGRPNQQGLGTIQPKKIEASNVDSTIEFGNIVVLQRMFQACSQIMDIDKQLLEGLYGK